MRALKILVIAMGVLLVLGVVGLVVGIVYKLDHPSHQAQPIAAAPLQPGTLPHSVSLPVGAKILGIQNDGNRVVVRLSLAEGGEELMLLDWATGQKLSVIDLK